MKNKLTAIAFLIILALLSGCAVGTVAVEPSDTPLPATPSKGPSSIMVDGRVVDLESGSYIIIRNEVDTKIYHKIDISGGLVVADGINPDILLNNVINAEVEMLDADGLPKETRLIKITGNDAPDYQVIDAKQAKAMIDAGGVLVVDVRTREEYDAGHIPDVYNVPLDEIRDGIMKVTENRDDTILLYCRSGNRSKVAARILTEMGYTNVYDFGGIVNWPYEIVEQ